MSVQVYSEAHELARFLGLRDWRKTSEIDLVSKVKSGLPAQAVEDVFSKVRLRKPEHIHAFIPKATYARKVKAKRLSRSESERLLSITKVFNEVLRLYHGDGDAAGDFLTRGHPMLGNRPPVELAVESTAGADLVLKLLARADAGVAV
jgi:putative toxin-antitoxin system antitoxin component (TIGR02293 family)